MVKAIDADAGFHADRYIFIVNCRCCKCPGDIYTSGSDPDFLVAGIKRKGKKDHENRGNP